MSRNSKSLFAAAAMMTGLLPCGPAFAQHANHSIIEATKCDSAPANVRWVNINHGLYLQVHFNGSGTQEGGFNFRGIKGLPVQRVKFIAFLQGEFNNTVLKYGARTEQGFSANGLVDLEPIPGHHGYYNCTIDIGFPADTTFDFLLVFSETHPGGARATASFTHWFIGNTPAIPDPHVLQNVCFL